MLDNTTYLPSNSAQNGIWFAEQLAPDGYLFNLAEYLSLEGEIDTSVFLDTLRYLANELEAPRSRIKSLDTGLTLEIPPEFDGDIPFIDMSDQDNPMGAALDWMNSDLKDQSRELWRAALIRLSPTHHLWYHCAHHILLDGYSSEIVTRRCSEIYSALLHGDVPPPSDLGSARTLLEAEQQYQDSKRIERDRAYWTEKLSPLPDPVSLSAGGTHTGGVISASKQLNAEDSNRLREFARQAGLSLPQIMVSAFAGYIHRMTGAEDMVLAMPVHGRLTRAERSVPMMAANAVALRFNFSDATSFVELARQTGKTMMSALRHQKYRFEQVRHDLGLTRADQQVARMAVNFEPYGSPNKFGPVEGKVTNLSNGSVDDLTLFIFDRGDRQGLTLTLNANPGLYSPAEIENHLQRQHLFLGEIMAHPDKPVGSATVYLPGELDRLTAWSEGAARPAGDSWLPAFDFHRQHTPEQIAVHDGALSLSYRALDAVASRIAQSLQNQGIRHGGLVALLLERTVLLPAAILAIHRLGAAYLPLDPEAPEKRNGLILETATPDLVLVSPALTRFAQENRTDSVVLDESLFTDEPAQWPADARAGRADDLAYVIFTSGSTGTPKGVDIAQGALWTLLAAIRDEIKLDETARWLAVTTIAFDIATLEMLLPLCVGGTVEIAQRHETLDPDLLNARIEASGATHLQATPSFWSLALESSGAALSRLTKLVGGEPLSGDLAQELATGGPLFNVYGPTETTIWSSIARITPEAAAHPVIGHPLAGEQIYVLDSFGSPSPVATIGEIWIGGSGLAQGYHERPDLTQNSFRDTPLGRLYRTGDLGRWSPSGELEHFGRIDFQVKVRGYRIETGEVESIVRQFDSITAAAVIKSAQHDYLLGYFCSPEQVDVAALEEHLRAHLPGYMVPQGLLQLPAMPMNANGKLDRKALPPIKPERSHPRGDTSQVLSPTENHLLARVRDALGREDVEIDDDFFQLGGTSLSAARLIAGLRRDYKADVALATVFSAPSLRHLAAEIDRATKIDPLAPVLELRKAQEGAPTIFCLHPVLGIGWAYSALLKDVPEEVGICALQSPGLTRKVQWPDLKTMARDYMASIRAIQTEGPYFLVGWSFGGLAAQEITRQLEAEGERVAALCLLDSFPFRTHNTEIEEAEKVRQTLVFLGEAPDPSIRTLDALAEKLVERPEVEALRVVLGDDRFNELRGRIHNVVEENLYLARQHVPMPVRSPIVAVHAMQGKSASLDTLLEWRGNPWAELSLSGAQQISLDCGHDDMLSPVSVKAFMPALLDALSSQASPA